MVNEDRLDGLLVQWGEARKEGRELSAEVLCQSHPELLEDLKRGIHAVTQMERFIKLDDDSDDNFLHLPDLSTISNRADETRLPESNLNLDEFCERLIDSELMDTQQVQKHRKVYPGADAVSFAGQLVAGKKLTRFQATVLLEGRDLPLVLDRYVILDEIGAGGMGAVYKALHQQMDRVVALKILPGLAVDSLDKIKRFQREVKAAAKLEHPHIVTAFDANESKGIHFLVMSYVSGNDLSAVVRKQGPLSAAKAVNYIAQAARGLDYAHRIGIVHRDIKPANLLLDKQGTVKILDMGLARIDNADPEHEKTVTQELTQAGMVMGTIAYLAPEQALDTRSADARSDMYSLGCTLYYLLTGRPVFSEDTMMKTMLAHREREIPSLRSDRIPEELDEVFHKMVAKKPEDRFQSMTELILALETLNIEDDEAEESGELAVPVSQAMHQTATFIDTSRDVILTKAESQPPRKRHWGILIACLLGFAGLGWGWAAGIFIKVETSAGTIILEIDQPELAGATVSVDGQKKLTIRTGEGEEPIEVTADEKTHTLKVVKGGFETFTKEFTVKAGKNETIKVRLEPLKTDVAVNPKTHIVVTPPPPSAALQALSRDQISPAALAYAGNGDPEKAPASLVAVLGEPEPIHTAGISALAYSTDGRWLASGGLDQKILLRDTRTGNVDRVLEGHQSTIICVAFTPDSRTLISGSADGKVNLWSVEDEQEPTALQFNINGMQMAVSPDGRFVAAGGSDGQVKLWKWGQWNDPLDLPAVADFSLAALSFSGNGERLACGWSMKGADSPIGLYRTVDGTLEETLTESNVYSLAFSPDGKSLASSRKFWDLATKTSIDFTPSGHVCFSPDSRMIAILNHFGGHVFDVESRSEIKGTTSLSYSAYTGLYRPAFSADGRTLAIADSSGAINFYDTADWKQRQEFFQDGHRSLITKLVVSRDGLAVLSGGFDKAVHRWRLTNPIEHEIAHQYVYNSLPYTLAYSSDGKTFAAASGSPAFVRNAATGEELFTASRYIIRVLYSPDGKTIAGLGFWDHIVRLWDAQLGKEVRQFPALAERQNELAFSADGRLLAAAGAGGSIVVWNAATGTEVATWNAGRTSSVAFHPNSTLLLTGHGDGKIAFWETSTWTKTRELSAHTGAVHGLRFTPDGRTLISSGADGTVHVRNADHDVPRAVIPVGFPASFPITFDLDASGQYLFASGPTPLIYVHRLPLEN